MTHGAGHVESTYPALFSCKKGLHLSQSDEFDIWCKLTLTNKQTKEVKENKDKYHFVSSTSTFDYLDLHVNKFYELNLRIVRFPISEDVYECIITNLPREGFGPEDIKHLYSKIWGIETSFRELKYAVISLPSKSKKPRRMLNT